MTVAPDAISTQQTWTTTPDPFTFTFTPAGTPKGIWLAIGYAATDVDLIDGPVTYGGVTMTRVLMAVDSVGELGTSIVYFLGTGIPTGAQTVSIGHTATASTKRVVVASVTAAADTEIGASGKVEGDVDDPQVALDTGANSSLRFVLVYSGRQDVTTDMTVLSGMTAMVAVDAGAFGHRWDRETTASAGSFTIGYTTAAADDVAMVAIAIQEVDAAQNLTGTLFTNPPSFLTGAVSSVWDLAGTLYENPPIFNSGTVTASSELTGVLFENVPTFPTGTVSSGAVNLDGVLFDNPPVFEGGTVTTGNDLAGVLYENPSVFFQGAITGGALVLDGALFVNDPVFLQGEIVGVDRVYPFWPTTTDDAWLAATDDGWPVGSELEWQGV